MRKALSTIPSSLTSSVEVVSGELNDLWAKNNSLLAWVRVSLSLNVPETLDMLLEGSHRLLLVETVIRKTQVDS